MMRPLLMICFALIAMNALAQSRKKKDDAMEMREPTSLEPDFTKIDFAPTVEMIKPIQQVELTYDKSQRAYKKQLKARNRTTRRNERRAEATIVDPSHFGHQHTPKKRKPGKMKYCKICGIKH